MVIKNKGLGFFDKAFFMFSFQMIAKKTSIYLSTTLYFLLIICYTSIVPSIAEIEPIKLFTMPTSSMFLMFCMALVSSFIAIEIFRTSIDDGTELLTVSKPLSRKEIVIAKLSIFLIYILSISLISFFISLFIFLNKYGRFEDNMNICLGMMVASIINGIIFGSISILISLYFNKILSLLITLSIAFILMVYSMLASFIIKSPIALMQKDDLSIQPTSLISFDGDEKIKARYYKGATALNLSNEKPKDIWEKYKNKSNYKISSFFDFGYQLSSFYTLSSQNDIVNSIQSMALFNAPIDFYFNENTNIENYNGINFGFLRVDIDNKYNSMLETKFDFNKLDLILSKGNSYRIDSKEQPQYNQSYEPSETILLKTYLSDEKWKKIWDDENIGKAVIVEMEKSENNNKNSKNVKKPQEIFLKNYFLEKKLSVQNKEKIMKELHDIIYSGLAYLINKQQIYVSDIFHYDDIADDVLLLNIIPDFFELDDKLKNMQWSEIKALIQTKPKIKDEFDANKNNRYQIRTILGLMGYHIDLYIDKDNAKIENGKLGYIKMNYNPRFTYENKNIKISDFTFRSSFNLTPKYIISKSNFQEGIAKSVINTNVLIIIWLIVAIVLFIITMTLYSRRDFA